MPQTSVSLTSAATQSAALSLNWRGGKPWTANVQTASSSGTGDFTVQYTLQDITSSAYASSGVPVPPTWLNLTAANFGISSAVISSAGYGSLHFQSSTTDTAAGITWTSNSPVAGLRISSTALSSTTLTLTVLQGEGW